MVSLPPIPTREQSSIVASPGGLRTRIPELDSLRAIAVILVFLHHFWPRAYLTHSVFNLARMGWIGVDMFFVLSGFLITGILLDTRGESNYFKGFYARRTLRIFPLYYASLAAIVLVMTVTKHGVVYHDMVSNWGSPIWFFAYLGNVRAAMQGAWPRLDFFNPLWSLQVEEQFYLLYPLLVALCSTKHLKAVLSTIIILSPLLRVIVWYQFPNNPYINYVLLPCRMDGLAWGGLITVKLREGARLPKLYLSAIVATLGIIAAVLFLSLSGYSWARPQNQVFGYSISAFAFAMLLVWTLSASRQSSAPWLRNRVLVYVGTISYGMYLLQMPSQMLAAAVLRVSGVSLDDNSLLLFGIRLCVTVAVSSVSFYVFERPIMNLKNSIRALKR